MSEPSLFPLFLKLRGRKVLLVGGGTVAASKLADLIAAGSLVTIVAPEPSPRIAAFEGVTIIRRGFVARDLDGVWLVVAAATPEVNREVAAAAEERQVFVNAVDDADRAGAYTGGVFRRGGVTIAVSTGGQAPALAGLLREALEAIVPEDVDTWVRTAHELRQAHRVAGIAMTDRRPLLLQSLNRLYEARGIQVETAP